MLRAERKVCIIRKHFSFVLPSKKLVSEVLLIKSSFCDLNCYILVLVVLKFLQTFKVSFRAQTMPITRPKQLVVAQESPRGVIHA